MKDINPYTSNLKRKYILFFLFISPAIILRIVMALYPIIETIYFSFLDYRLLRGIQEFVGLENFKALIESPETRAIMSFTLVFVGVSVLIQLMVGLVVAQILNQKFFGRDLARTLNLLPWVIPVIVGAYAWRWMLHADYGLFADVVIRLFGFRPSVFTNVLSARIALIVANSWRNTPFMVIVILAGLQSIPQELYEAARVDGANIFQRFKNITFPALTTTLVTLGLFNIIWQIANIDVILGTTRGGPGTSTSIISYRIYQGGMIWFDWGRSSAMSVFLILIVAVIALIGLFLFRKYEFTV